MPIINELDSQSTGLIEVKSVIKLLVKHSKLYNRDFNKNSSILLISWNSALIPDRLVLSLKATKA